MAAKYLKSVVVLTLSTNVISSSSVPVINSSTPSVKIQNGTVVGVHSSSYNQEYFLGKLPEPLTPVGFLITLRSTGIPYAQPPVGELRLQLPQPLNTSFGTKYANEYGPICVGLGVGDKQKRRPLA